MLHSLPLFYALQKKESHFHHNTEKNGQHCKQYEIRKEQNEKENFSNVYCFTTMNRSLWLVGCIAELWRLAKRIFLISRCFCFASFILNNNIPI
jgi:hypothetical protein